MARVVAKIEHFARLLKNSPVPAFVLDDKRHIVLWNAGCVAWSGAPATAMFGQVCVHQAPDVLAAGANLSSAQDSVGAESPSAAALAAALCPPPEVFHGSRRRVRRAVVFEGRALDRWIDYVPLGAGDQGHAPVLALVEPTDAADGDVPADGRQGAEPEELHRQLVLFRQQHARRLVPERFLGTTPGIVRAREQAALAAKTNASVLVVGPPGSGKSELARSIHYARFPNGNGLLVPIEGAALGSELLSSTLRSAWLALGEGVGKGAEQRRLSRQGEGGTLLLMDVDCLPADIQQPLVEAISSRPPGVGVISTTSRSLDAAAAAGKIRADLACLLSTLVIHLPALAERLDDLPLVAQALLEEVNATSQKQVAGFTPEALDVLAGFQWPGGCDELAIVVAQSHRRAAGAEIGPRDLPERLHQAAHSSRRTARAGEKIVLADVLAQVERDLIERALRRARGNKSRAAKLLGLTRPRLYRRMVQLGLEPPAEGGVPES